MSADVVTAALELDLADRRGRPGAKLLRTLLAVSLAAIVPVAAAADPDRFQASRVVAFGDVHGAYDSLVELLVTVGVIDGELRWRGGDTHLVSLGDLTDRGPDSRKVMDLLRRLQDEARSSGGRVHVVLGNHELMNMTDDLRYVSVEERQSYPDLGEGLDGLRTAFAPDGPYGSWLLAQPVAVVVNDSAFVHGGLSSLLESQRPDTLNRTVPKQLRELLGLRDELEQAGELPPGIEVQEAAEALAERLEEASPESDGGLQAGADKPGDGLEEPAAPPVAAELRPAAQRFIDLVRDPVFGNHGPFWYRGNARCHPLIDQPALTRVLDAWGSSRVVVGHTPTLDRRVHERLGGRVLLADTGMLEPYYHGRGSAVVLEDDKVKVVYADGEVAAPQVDDDRPLFPLDEADVLARLQDQASALFAGGSDAPWRTMAIGESGSVMVKLDALSRGQQDAALAAVRLDRLLQLNLAAPVARVSAGSVQGVATALWAGALTEADRVAAGLGVTNPCARGSVLDLLYAFDALIGNEGRSSTSIVYDRRTLRLGSIDHARSLGRGDRFPAYTEQTSQQLPAALASRLRNLDQQALEAALGDLLGKRQIRGILARRDKLLATWTVAGF